MVQSNLFYINNSLHAITISMELTTLKLTSRRWSNCPFQNKEWFRLVLLAEWQFVVASYQMLSLIYIIFILFSATFSLLCYFTQYGLHEIIFIPLFDSKYHAFDYIVGYKIYIGLMQMESNSQKEFYNTFPHYKMLLSDETFMAKSS